MFEKLLFLSVAVLLVSTRAQTSMNLIGTWQAQVQGIIINHTINADGSYTAEIPSQNYFEQGAWQLEGKNYSQQWNDPATLQERQLTYTLVFLSADAFTLSSGDLGNAVLGFIRVGAAGQNGSAVNPLTQKDRAVNPLTQPTPAATASVLPIGTGEYVCVLEGFDLDMNTTTPFGSDSYPLEVDIPSSSGNLVLNGDGTYYRTQQQAEYGTFVYDASTKRLTFTGALASFPTSYEVVSGSYNLYFDLDASGEDYAPMVCSRESK